MILQLMIEEITDKEADDLVQGVYGFIQDQGFLVMEYWVTEG